MRAAGIVHTAPPRSISSQRALRTSPERGGQHQELERQPDAGAGVATPHPRERGVDLGVWQRPLVPLHRGDLRQRGRDRVAGGVVGAQALRDGPLHHGADALPEAPGGHPSGGPDGQQHGHDVGAGHGVHGLTADARQGVGGKAGAPLAFGTRAILPVGGVDRDDGLQRLGEGRHGHHRAAGIAALGDGPGVLQRALAGHGEGDDGVAAEAEAGGPAVDAHALRPGFVEAAAQRGPDEQAEAEAAATVAVATGYPDVPDEGGGQHEGSIVTSHSLFGYKGC